MTTPLSLVIMSRFQKCLLQQAALAPLLALLSLVNASSQVPPPAPPGLTVRRGDFYRGGHPYRGVGANYFDLFLRILADPTNTTSLKGSNS